MNPYDPLKRLIDIVVGAAMGILSLPVQAVIAIMVRYRLGDPVIFRQQRPGKNGRVFELLKFRTMLDYDESRDLVTDRQRLTPFGRMLRSTSLDELPSLWNVLKGDMSLVGPRPLLVKYLDRYTNEQARRHEVRPGITGLAQISGRNALSWDDRFAKDIEYVDSRSLRLDIRIILATVINVLKRDGINAKGEATMTEFMGDRDTPDE